MFSENLGESPRGKGSDGRGWRRTLLSFSSFLLVWRRRWKPCRSFYTSPRHFSFSLFSLVSVFFSLSHNWPVFLAAAYNARLYAAPCSFTCFARARLSIVAWSLRAGPQTAWFSARSLTAATLDSAAAATPTLLLFSPKLDTKKKTRENSTAVPVSRFHLYFFLHLELLIAAKFYSFTFFFFKHFLNTHCRCHLQQAHSY